ncbi:MAG: HEAT repeat domain-containing protein [Anaerolinea sp.]|nr:HEAT repeat domain-containing protein [Anaerolinea sp.]
MANRLLIERLLNDLRGNDEDKQRQAIYRLLELSDPSTIPALLEALRDKNVEIRSVAAEALGTIGDEAALDGLEDVLRSDDDDSVRAAAAKALGTIGDPTSIPVLLQTLKTENSELWHSAAEALWLMNEDVMPHVITALTHPDHDTRRVGLQAVLWLTAEWDDDEVADRDDYELRDAWGWWN